MGAHAELNKKCDQLGLTTDTSVAGITTITAGNTTLDFKKLTDLERACQAEGHEIVFTAGALKIRPKDSNL